jgi:hypothetical protein
MNIGMCCVIKHCLELTTEKLWRIFVQKEEVDQGWRTFMRARAQIVDSIWRYYFACPRKFWAAKSGLGSISSLLIIIILCIFYIIIVKIITARKKTEYIWLEAREDFIATE